MGRARQKPKPEAVILPPEYDEDEDPVGGGIPDDDGNVYLERKERSDGEEKPKRKPRRRSP